MNHNSELLLKLISDVLDISRLDSNNQEFVIERYDLAKIVSEIYRTHQVIIHPPVEFRLKMDDSWTVYVAVDKLRLIQVISNFLSNANKFTVEGSITPVSYTHLGWCMDCQSGRHSGSTDSGW